jgi:hypothetical protein
MSKSLQRNKSIGVKVREEDFASLQGLADRDGKPLAEWCRDALVRIARHPAGTPIAQALLAEVIALRTIVGNLVYGLASNGKVTPQQMAAFIDRADQTKLKRAIEFLTQVQEGGEHPAHAEPQAGGGRR